MRYTSKTGFGRVEWPAWHDALIVLIVIILVVMLS